MQTYEKHLGRVNTLARVAENVTELQFEFWFQVLETINKSFGFVIALQMNGLLIKLLAEEAINPYQILVIFILILMSMILARIKEHWALKMKEQEQRVANATVQAIKELKEDVSNISELQAILPRSGFFS